MKILADINIPYLEGVFEPFYDIDYLPGEQINKEHLKEVEVLIVRTRTKCDKNLLDGSTVKLIVTATIGYDHIDTAFCKGNGISWVNAPGCNSGAVQQWFMASLLLYAKRNNIDLTKRTLGVVGVGNVGEKIVKFADALGMYVILNDPPREKKEGSCLFRGLDTVVRECDIITFHVPLNLKGEYSTRHMLDKDFFEKVSPETLILNSSRGGIMDSSALYNAINNNHVKDVILDVWENEPEISTNLLNRSFIGTPHIAGYSAQGKANGTSKAVTEVAKYLDLPLDDWYPEASELTNRRIIKINTENKSVQDVLTEAVLQTYSIESDDNALRKNPDKFEEFRSNYNYRFEPPSYCVKLLNGTDSIYKTLKAIGFEV